MASTRRSRPYFVHAARTVPPDAEGADRARSATEAFLYRRLEALAETKGRFRLNAVLPIAFDGLAKPEVDLMCDDARLAVELDGAQHLADPVAYRRDRRKDRLLQENGFFVLRFLGEDVGKELDLVLDTVLRSLSRRTTRFSPAGSFLCRHEVRTDVDKARAYGILCWAWELWSW